MNILISEAHLVCIFFAFSYYRGPLGMHILISKICYSVRIDISTWYSLNCRFRIDCPICLRKIWSPEETPLYEKCTFNKNDCILFVDVLILGMGHIQIFVLIDGYL